MQLYRQHNRKLMKSWITAILAAVAVPFIFKMGVEPGDNSAEAVDVLTGLGVPIIHAVADEPAVFTNLAKRCPFLIGGGGVKDVATARRILDAGAGAVAVASAAMKDPDFSGNLQIQLRG